MSSRTSIQQVVSIEEPAGATLGDEWYNPTTGILLKRMLAGGVVGWTTILISSSTITSLPSLSITNNTAATSATTGALQVVGGVGIGGDLYINGNVALGTLSESLTRLAYASTNNSKLLVRPSFDINASGTITAADATAFNNVLTGVTAVNSSTVNRLPFVLQHFDNTATGVMVLPQTILGYAVGSTSYSGQIFLTASLNNNIKHFLRVGDDIADTAGVRIKATITLVGTGTDATSTTTGALQVLGGAGIGGTLYVGGNVSLLGNTLAAKYLTLSPNTISSDVSSLGAYVQLGNPISNQAPDVSGIQFANYSGAGTGLAAIRYNNGGATYGLELNAGTVTTDKIRLTAGATGGVVVTSPTAATSTNTGALQVVGGVGIGGSVYVGNRIGFINTNTNVSAVYQIYNTVTNSLDTIFG